MIIDRTNKITKILGLISLVCFVLCLISIVKAFVFYKFIMMLINLVVGIICIKDTRKDKKISIIIFTILVIYEIYRIISNEINLSMGINFLCRIIGYITFIMYFAQILKNKKIVVIGGCLVSFIMLNNVFDLMKTYHNFQKSIAALSNINNSLNGSMIFNIIVVSTYVVPTLTFTILILCNLIKFDNSKILNVDIT